MPVRHSVGKVGALLEVVPEVEKAAPVALAMEVAVEVTEDSEEGLVDMEERAGSRNRWHHPSQSMSTCPPSRSGIQSHPRLLAAHNIASCHLGGPVSALPRQDIPS